METIIYQGQEIAVQVVNSICGDGITTSTPKEYSGEEELLRDEAGHYYLRQRIDYIDPVGDHKHDDLLEASGRTRLHRINLNAAILWATTRLNSVTADLRADAANLLTEGRGYTDPTPTPVMRRAVELSQGRGTAPLKGDYKAAVAALEPDGESVTVSLTLPAGLFRAVLAMGEYDRQEGFCATVAHGLRGDVVAWLEAEDERTPPADFLLSWLKEHANAGTIDNVAAKEAAR